ncbi:hypothetical protein AN191_16390 [Loktanella sp. 5RATIMAR09]|uniref:hypothetical protein n=1 Tax=Loktanella sp. 5RATIMAR09 TaxID=1225655 RepID=UPI0006EB7B30|nr:hypothetical protein [Loktanella sp. 5RATIMAR09]KQI70757.1 hypothetical protein AN191_16390 [Loktanella sp. 5RATIMAR09]
MKHFTASLWKATCAPRQTIGTVIDGFAKNADIRNTAPTKAISYTLKPAFVRSFATSGYPFLTFYEFNDLTGWCRDTYFAPDHVAGYNDDIGKSYTVWTHQAVSAYRRHIILDELVEDIEVSFEVPSLDCASWFPLRICLFDRGGLYFQTDQKLVVDRIHDSGSVLTSWKKIPALRESLPRLHQQTSPAIS